MALQLGLTLSSEEHGPNRLVEMGKMAEENGFDFVSISDHYHPWVGEQGHSPFVWSVLGGLSQATSSIDVAVGVTCPSMRIHPAILAQAAATTAVMLPGRFTWGVGSGEALNEHICGDRWPPAPVRIERMVEAIEIIRRLWSETSVTHYGTYFTVEDARILDKPDSPPPIIVSAFGDIATRAAAEHGDGLWITGAATDTVELFRSEGGSGPVYSQITVCWATDRDKAIDTAHRLWPNTAVPGQLAQDLRTIEHFEQAAQAVTRENIAGQVPAGPDPQPYIDAARRAIEAGVDHLYFHQIGNDQEGFLEFWKEELEDSVRSLGD